MRIIKTKHEYDGKFEYEISSTGEGSSRQWWWFVLTLIIISLFVGDMHFMQKCLDELTCKLQNIFDLVRVLGILTMIIWIHKSRKKDKIEYQIILDNDLEIIILRKNDKNDLISMERRILLEDTKSVKFKFIDGYGKVNYSEYYMSELSQIEEPVLEKIRVNL